MERYTRWNIIIGWLSFAIALATYFLTLEPTVSWWDCGEFIACSDKLLVGHPPGAPFFLLLGRFFAMLTSNPEKVAMMVNSLSAIASAFTILFLFWTITHLAKKLIIRSDEDMTMPNLVLVIGAGLTGALAYTFSDSFWFSAVEGEVYATSSLFTAVVFWAILKWENIADQKHADRWLILIAYLMGLSIGVHLLNLLAIPAIVLVYYFRRHEVTRKGVLRALLAAVLILGVVMYGIIQGITTLATKFELAFVNGLDLPFNSGVIFYAFLLVGGIIYGIWYTHKKQKVIWNSIITGIAVIIIGFSSYALIVIRSQANPPMDMNNPENVFSLLSYLNREQYGDRPLLTGHYFDDEIHRDQSGYPLLKYKKAVYRKDTTSNKYIVADRKPELTYEEGAKLFPRMYSTDGNHIKAYREWGGVSEGEKSNFGHNLKFFFRYQIGHMYFRYFMWNFAGKQNDTQSHGSLVDGNWISGVTFIDNQFRGDQNSLPDKYKNQESRNTYYFLPLILGILGLLTHFNRDVKNFWVVMALFFFTGIAIVIYLNQTPFQPRERDYAYVGSFYAFAIWIGLGVIAVNDALKKYLKVSLRSFFTVGICLILVPGLMARENWNDHDRSGRYTARDIARNYLDSCDENAILFTNGDNDTYPLWYVQEVEGYRTDVRVINLMLLNSEWNIRQLMRKSYESEVIPMSLPINEYLEGTNNSFIILEDPRRIRMKTLIEGIKKQDKQFVRRGRSGDNITVIPTNKFVLPVDSVKVISNETVKPEDAEFMENEIEWTMSQDQYTKSVLAELDMLASFDWERPIYFVSGGNEGALNLEEFFQFEGLAYKLVPIKTEGGNFFNYGRINTDDLYDNLMKEFSWGRMNKQDVHIDHYNRRTVSVIRLRKNFVRLAEALLEEGENTKAVEVLDRIMELTPHSKFPYDYFISGITYPQGETTVHHSGVIETYYKCGAIEKANDLLMEFAGILQQDLVYYDELKPRHKPGFAEEYYQSRNLYQQLYQLASAYRQDHLLQSEGPQ